VSRRIRPNDRRVAPKHPLGRSALAERLRVVVGLLVDYDVDSALAELEELIDRLAEEAPR
jgi:hypothetical protein